MARYASPNRSFYEAFQNTYARPFPSQPNSGWRDEPYPAGPDASAFYQRSPIERRRRAI
jgi:hypothetical protein